MAQAEIKKKRKEPSLTRSVISSTHGNKRLLLVRKGKKSSRVLLPNGETALVESKTLSNEKVEEQKQLNQTK